jgi:hypothetical protein
MRDVNLPIIQNKEKSSPKDWKRLQRRFPIWNLEMKRFGDGDGSQGAA